MHHNFRHVRSVTARCLRAALAAAFVLASAACFGSQQPDKAAAQSPDLKVEFLGAERGYAFGSQSVVMVCVIRNVGARALPENAARVRCYPLTGLDFMEGQLWPVLPALPPNRAVAYRWRLALTDTSTPLVFSVLISPTQSAPAVEAAANPARGPQAQPAPPDFEVPPRVYAVLIPRFASAPHLLGSARPTRAPRAIGSRAGALVGNDRVMAHVLAAQDRVPVLVLAGREGTDWKDVAISDQLLQVRSGEEGQQPWPECFRWTDVSFQETKGSAVLTLYGSVGSNWTARVTLESRPDTAVINGTVRLMARRNVRLISVQLPRLLAASPGGAAPARADGTPEFLSSDQSPLGDEEPIAAAHSGALTFGVTWPARPPLTGWQANPVPAGDADRLPVLGALWGAGDRGELISAGAAIEMPFRLFAFGPSDTVKDSLKFKYP